MKVLTTYNDSDEPLAVYVDRNDAAWTSQRTYIDELLEAFGRRPDVRVVDSPQTAEIIHLNYLNPLGRIVEGKQSRRRHLADLRRAVGPGGPPVVVTAHGLEEFSDVESTMYLETASLQGSADAVKRALQVAFGRFVDGVITISSMDQQFLLDGGFAENRLYQVSHGVDERFLNGEISAAGETGTDGEISTDGEFVLHVSKCSPHKNPQAIIKTARRLDERLVIAGKGWDDRYGTVFGDIDSVELAGYVSPERLADLYRSAAVFYFPSTYEPFGLPILEAIACGTPVVASVNSAGRDLCEESIVLVEPHDTDQHIETLRRLVADVEQRDRMAQAGRTFAEERTWDRTAAETLRVYHDVLYKNRYKSRLHGE